MGLDAGSLDRRVTILRQGIAEDEHGDAVEGFQELVTRWASKRPAPGTERLADAENAATAPTVFRMRWLRIDPLLNPKDRLLCEGVTYDIKSVFEIGRREGHEVAAVARTG